MKRLAELPNVAVKISGLGSVHRQPKLEVVRPYVSHVVETFGVSRCMIASDFPTDKMFGNIVDTPETLAASIYDLGDDDRRALWGGNANRIYRLGLELD